MAIVNRAASPYDKIGTGYAKTRRPDPGHRRAILRALGDSRSVVNVGAGDNYHVSTHGHR